MPRRRRRQLHFVLALMLIGALVEMATIGAVVPFLALLTDADRLNRLWVLSALFDQAGANSQQTLAVATGLFILIALLAGAIRLMLSWSSQKFVFGVAHDLAVDIHRRLLLQPYPFHITQNSAALAAGVDKTGALAFYVLLQLMQAAIAALLSLFIIAALLYVNPLAAVVAAGMLSLFYWLVSAVANRRLERNSRILGASWDERVQIVQESLGGIRDVLLDNSQAVYLDAFRRVDARFSTAKANTAFIGAAPRFIIESLGIAFIAVLAFYLTARQGSLAAALPILGALALGAQRLLPLLQQIYLSWSTAVGNNSVTTQVLGLLRLHVDEDLAHADDIAALPLRRQIRFEDVSFSYPNRRTPAIHEIAFDITRGERVALIGKTGSGKSTLADLLMGLLEPTGGRILIDDVPLTRENRRNWQRSIAHVPQAIFLADTSIARNIALGVPTDKVDLERVIEASVKAQLHDFVSSLPDGYGTYVGERGIRLSGGQRQRLGIARAIYKQAPVLVLDEATSALDDETEAAVLRALDRLGAEGRTIIMIAHRLSTISFADSIIRLDRGSLAKGSTVTDEVAATVELNPTGSRHCGGLRDHLTIHPGWLAPPRSRV